MPDIEFERYELSQGPAYRFEPGRRDFFKLLTGIVVVLTLERDSSAQESGNRGTRRRSQGQDVPQSVEAWLHISEDGGITVYTGKTEVGQNIRTSLTQAVAEELRIDPGAIQLVMADTDLTPFDMGTFGSRTTPTMAPQLRKAAAAAREMLIAMAAEQLKVEPADLRIVGARFLNHDKSKTRILAEDANGRTLVTVM